jgi:cyanophycinase
VTLGNNATVDEHADNGVPAGRLLIIGGGEDRCCGAGVLERFVELCGGEQARITLATTATGIPDEVHAEYEGVFRKLGVEQTRELRLRGRADADSDAAAAALRDSTGSSSAEATNPGSWRWSAPGPTTSSASSSPVAWSSRTSAGATAMGRTMIVGGEGPEVSAATVRTGPGLGLAPRLLIDMHLSERGRLPRLLSAVALDPDHLGVGIDENTAILVDGDTFEVLGTGVATVADGEQASVVHAAGDCDPITLFDVRLHLMPAGCVFDIVRRAPSIGPAHNRY